jgi:hypothetical protein
VSQSHHCHARGCKIHIRPELLMCRSHWFMVPERLRTEVWRTYRQGQCEGDPPPSEEWHRAADAAIEHVAKREAELAQRGPDHG